MSYEEYLEWSDDRFHGEWVDGEVIVFEKPSVFHQDLVLWLGALLRIFARRRSLGHVVVAEAEFERKLDAVRSSRKLDILFVATAHLDQSTEARLVGPADLAVEIVSPSSGPRDHREKLIEYAVAGIPEYWVIDPRPLRHAVTVYRLDDERAFELVPHRSHGTLISDAPQAPTCPWPGSWPTSNPTWSRRWSRS